MAKPVRKHRPLSRLHNPLQVNDLRKRLAKHRQKWDRKTILRAVLWLAVAGIGAIVLLFAWYSKDLPTPQGIRHDLDQQANTNIYDRTGQHLLYAISGQQRRVSIPLDQESPFVRNGVVAIEDHNFYKHSGIDFGSLARSAFYDIILRNKAYGGSTLTQQLVKNAILKDSQKRFDRKIREAILSIEIEAMYPKDKILELYLNEIPMGSNVYGMEAASETFFGKKSQDLTLDQAATLAAMVQAPSHYSPYGEHTDELITRRNLVLTDMQKYGYITKQQQTDAVAQKLAVIPRHDTILAPHFVMYVRDIIAQKYGEGIFSHGLKVITTLDYEQQKAAEQAVTDGAAQNKQKYGVTNAALVSLNPKTGEVLSMVGSADYFNSDIDGQFNVTTAKRQPGSSFKPFVYATLLKQKYDPASIFYDLPTTFGGTYKPNNFDGRFRGPVTMREALAQSLNIPAVKALDLAGVKEAIKTASDLGISTLDSPDKYGLSLVLGSAETKPIEMAQAYGVFANGGVRQDVEPILSIEDNTHHVLEQFKPEDHRKSVLDPQIAYQISNMLSDQIAKAPVFGKLLSFGDRVVASKTGTTNGYSNGAADVRDAWTVGYTPSLSVAIWTGNNDHSPLGKGVLAADAAVPIFREYMNSVLPSLPVEQFNRPNGIQTITVDKLSNKLPSDATPPDDVISDVFASWQVPTQQDDIHVKVNVCKGTELLATDQTPADQIEQKYYVNIHSEKPNDPAWEGPVQDWANSNGFTNRPPTDKCTTYTSDNLPQVSITSPSDGASLNNGFTISANASSQFGISKVDFAIDNQSINTATAAPYQATYDASTLSSGSHTIKVTATDADGRTNTASITVNVAKETTPPGNVNNVTAAGGKGQAILTWTNPSDSDLSRVRVYISDNSGQLGLRYSSEADAKPSSPGTITVGGLTSGKTYYFTLRPVDVNNNENQSTTQYSAAIQ